MLVPLKDIEPGSVVVIPEEARMQLGGTSEAVLIGVEGNRYPAFWAGGRQWGYPYSPRGTPDAFDVLEKPARVQKDWINATRQGFVNQVRNNYYSGCDPEIFVTDKKGKVIPATTFLQDKKASPSMFYDGLQAEFCPVAASCLEQLGEQVRKALMAVRNTAQSHNPDARLSIQNTIQLTPAEMRKLSEEDIRFRCSTSMNIYNDGGELPEARAYLWRFAGGHIHVGCGSQPPQVIRSMVRAMDGFLGVAAVSLAASFDNPERRRMYGRAGEFRVPGHGLEYRVLSNYWLCSPLIYHLTFEIARVAYRLGQAGAFDLVWEGSTDETRECINYCDVKLARKILDRNRGLYEVMFSERWDFYTNKAFLKKAAWDTIRNGLEVVVKDPGNIDKNWYLDEGWANYGECQNGKWRMLTK